MVPSCCCGNGLTLQDSQCRVFLYFLVLNLVWFCGLMIWGLKDANATAALFLTSVVLSSVFWIVDGQLARRARRMALTTFDDGWLPGGDLTNVQHVRV